MKYQSYNEIVDITDWEYDPDHPFYPEGSRDKYLLRSPKEISFNFLKKNYAYLFKLSRERYPAQYWAEIIAYRVGCLMGVEVPPAFVAIDRDENHRPAALIEWFYEYPPSPTAQEFELYVSGGSYMKRLIRGYDQKKGTQHNVRTLIRFLTAIQQPGVITNPLNGLAKIFIFDSIIGNTDRHQDNWGIVWKFEGEKVSTARLSPAFDNGTSLGHEILENKLVDFLDPQRLQSYIKRGRHHVKWNLKDANQCGHMELIKLFADRFPEHADTMRGCLDFDTQELKESVYELSGFSIRDNLSLGRCEFVVNLILERREYLLDILGS